MDSLQALLLVIGLQCLVLCWAFWVMYLSQRLIRNVENRLTNIEMELRRLRTGSVAIALLLPAGSSAAQSTQPPYFALLEDLRRLPEEQRQRTRYLSLAHVPPVQRAALWKVLSFHCNALSVEAEIVPVRPLAGGAVAAIVLFDYGWTEELWGTLADSEPYHYVKLQPPVLAKRQWYQDSANGSWWTKDEKGNWQSEAQWEAAKKTKLVTALAPWLGDPAALVNLTQSRAPIVRADWFLWQTAIQADRVPGYYDFLGIKDQKDFFRLVGFDAKLVTAAKRRELLEAVSISTVTQQPRRLGRFPVIDGFLWRTFDNRKALEDRNPLRILNGGFQFDASEEFGTGPNGLIIWGLFSADGSRQDSAPDFIASDSTAHHTDRRVHVNLSCIRCHGPNDGVQPVDGWVRNLLGGQLRLQSPDPDLLRKLRAQYLRDLDGPIRQDRQRYAGAVAEATGGMKVAELARAYGAAYVAYDSPVDLDRAAAEVGLSPVEFRRRLDRRLKSSGTLDTVLSAFLMGRSVPREQWAEAYAEAALVKP